MSRSRRGLSHRGILVALWLVAAVAFLIWRRPGFWITSYGRYEAAQALAAENRQNEALDAITRAVSVDRDNPGFLVFKGNLELSAGRLEEARASFARARQVSPNDLEVRLGLAEANVRLGQTSDGVAILKALPSSELTIDQRYRRQSLLGLAKDFPAALDDAALIDTEFTDVARLGEALHWAMGAQSWERAVGLADRLLAATSDAAVRQDAVGNKAAALDAQGRAADALEAYDTIASPANLDVRARLASQIKRHEQAATLLAEVQSNRPGDTAVARQRITSLEQTGRRDEAIAAYHALLELEDDPELRVRLVGLLNALRDYEAAWRELAAIPAPSSELRILRLQLRTAFWAGHLGDAVTLFDALTPLSNDDVALAADLALTLTQQGQGESGERIYRRLIDEGRATPATRERYAWWLAEARRYADAWTIVRPMNAADLSDRGRDLQTRVAFWAGDYEAAAPMLDRWVRESPTAEGWRDLAEAARHRQDPQTELRALEAYLALNPRDVDAGARRAGLLDRASRIDPAIAAYLAVLQLAPDRVNVRRDYARILERSGRLRAAVTEYETVWTAEAKREGTARGNADLALIIARVTRQDKRPADAMTWYARATGAGGVPMTNRLAIEIAQNEIDAKQASAAQQRMDALVRSGATDEDVLAFAANAAATAGDPATAAAHLEALNGRRRLTGREQLWQAGLYRTAGNNERALAAYARMSEGGSAADRVEALTAMGDLYYAGHDLANALAAWTKAREQQAPAAVTLKLARVKAALGRFDDAVPDYEQYLQRGSPDGLRQELARVYLGAGRFDRAERWARDATQSRTERGTAADLLLAQALHLQGRVRESYTLSDGQPRADHDTPELLELYAQLAAARNQHLRAIELYDRAIARGANAPGDLWMWSARSAYLRGDYYRSDVRLDRAARNAIQPPYAPRIRQELDTASSPALSTPTRVFDDSNDLSLAQSGLRARWLPGRLLDLFGEATQGTLSQKRDSFRRTRLAAGVANAFLSPIWAFNASAGTERYEGSPSLTIGRAGLTRHFNTNSSISASGYRDSMWSDHDLRDPRQFNRVFDLAALGPAFAVHGVTGRFDRRAGLLQQTLVEVGHEWFEDDNLHQYAYGHQQFVLRERPGAWRALRPNVYWERFANASPLYFSPSQFVSVGTMLHEVRGRGPWRIEAEVNPKLTLFQSRAGFAMHGLLDASRDIGLAQLGGGAFLVYDQRTNYWAWRLAGQLGLRLAR